MNYTFPGLSLYLGHIKYLILTTVLLSCGKKQDSSNGINIMVVDKGDTLSHFYYPYYQNYSFMGKGDIDSVITSKAAQRRVEGTFMLGMINKSESTNKYLTFKTDSKTSLTSYDNPSQFFLHEEYQLNDYKLSIIDDYYDTTSIPLSRYQTLAAIDELTKDTLLFQEFHIGQLPNQTIFKIIAYQNLETRIEMESLFEEALSKMQKSTKEQQ